MNCRDYKFLVVLMIGAVLISIPASPAERLSTPRIGVLVPSLTSSPLEEGLREGLRQAGYIEDKNIVIEWRRYAPAHDDLVLLASGLAQSGVDVIVTVGSPATQAALKATTVPVVFTVVGDPVATGFAASLAHPGGHSTGVSTLAVELFPKRLELLHQMAPRATRFLYLMNSSNPAGPGMLEVTKKAAQALRVKLIILDARNTDELNRALRAIPKSGAHGILITGEQLFSQAKTKLPRPYARPNYLRWFQLGSTTTQVY